MLRWTDRPAMTIAVDFGRKATKQTNKLIISYIGFALFLKQIMITTDYICINKNQFL